MITKQEILGGHDKKWPLTAALEDNLLKLLAAVNIVRAVYGSPLYVSSGYRPKEVNDAVGGSPKSSHLTCQAVDFHDRDGKFAAWCLANLDVLEQAGLYMEDPRWTVGWVHLSTSRPKSGKRVFIP